MGFGGCWLTKSVFSGTNLVAFCGVAISSPPNCFSKENKFVGESQWGRSEVFGSSGASEPSAAAED